MDDPDAIADGEARGEARVDSERARWARPVRVEPNTGNDLHPRDHREDRVDTGTGGEVDAIDEDAALACDDVVIVGEQRKRVGGVLIHDDIRARSEEDGAGEGGSNVPVGGRVWPRPPSPAPAEMVTGDV